MNFNKYIKENWFKLALLVAIFWFVWVLSSGIEINHRGWVNTESTGLGLSLEL